MKKKEIANNESKMNNRKKILILMNGSFALFKFKKELLYELNNIYKLILVLPFDDFSSQLSEISAEMISIQVDRRGKNFLKDIILYRNMKEILISEKPDMVLCYTIKMNIYGGIICQQLNIPYILNITGLGSAFNNEIFSQFYKFLYKIAAKRVNYIFFQNTENLKSFIGNIIQKDKAILVEGSGVNLEEYKIEGMNSSNKITFTFIGRIMKDKGIEEFLNAAKIINEKHSNTHFQIIGRIEEKKYLKVTGSICSERIKYLGFTKDIREAVKRSDCIINPSYHEGLSNVLLEAAAMGRPLLATDIPGCREVVQNGFNGYLFSKRSTESLVDAIEKFLELEFDKRKIFGQNSREIVEKRFDRKIVNKIYMEKIHEILKTNY